MPADRRRRSPTRSQAVPICSSRPNQDRQARQPGRRARSFRELEQSSFCQPEDKGQRYDLSSTYPRSPARRVEQLLRDGRAAPGRRILEPQGRPKLGANRHGRRSQARQGAATSRHIPRPGMERSTSATSSSVPGRELPGRVRAVTEPTQLASSSKSHGPSTPVEILGLSDVPGAGDPGARSQGREEGAGDRRESAREDGQEPHPGGGEDLPRGALSKRISDFNEPRTELRVIRKGDDTGLGRSRSPITLSRSSPREGQNLSVILRRRQARSRRGRQPGDQRQKGVSHRLQRFARPSKARALAEENKVEIRQALESSTTRWDDVKSAMEGSLPATLADEEAGADRRSRRSSEVKGVVVAGSYVTQGKIVRGNQARLLRDGNVVWDGKVAALKRFKEDVKDVAEGVRVRHFSSVVSPTSRRRTSSRGIEDRAGSSSGILRRTGSPFSPPAPPLAGGVIRPGRRSLHSARRRTRVFESGS